VSRDLTRLFRPRCFAIIDPHELPLPHNPKRCDFYDRALWGSRAPLAEQRAQWLEAIGSRWKRCYYHAADWRSIAEAACWVLEQQLQVNADLWSAEPRDYLARAPGGVLPAQEAAFADSLFMDPITWAPGEDALEDGQHRACGLRLAGARAVPVLDASRGDACPWVAEEGNASQVPTL
jgi:hypothetical protein